MRFTIRRPASAEVSPCCHRPSGGDVACSIHVGITRARTAGDAPENRLALTVFRRDMAAIRASLRRIRCRDELNPPRGFVLQSGHQQSPPLAADLAIEAAFLCDAVARVFTSTARRAGHRGHLQVLHTNSIEPAGQIGGGLFHPVTAPPRFTSTQPRNGQFRSCTPIRAALTPGQTPLQSAKSSGFTGTKARNVQQLPVGQRDRDRDAAVDTHHAAVTGSWDGVGDGGESDVPAPRAVKSDSVRLHGVGDGAGPAKAHPAHLRYPDLPVAAVEPFDVARFEPDLSESFMLAGLAPRRATVGASEKVAHRLGEVPQSLLLHGLRPGCQPTAFGAGRGQLGTLLVVARRLATWLPVPLLLYGKIPHKPSMATVLDQHCGLLTTGKQPKPAHIDNLSSTTDNPSKGGKRCFAPG